MTAARRGLLAGLVPAAILLALALPALLFAPRLPATIATHWGLSGRPDGSAPRALLALPAAVWVAVWTVLVSRLRSRPQSTLRGLVGAGALGGLLVAVQATTIWANLDAPDWDQARTLGPVQVLVPLLAALALGAIGLRLARPGMAWSRPTPVAAAELAPGTRGVWVSRVTNPWLAGLSVLLTAVLVAGAGDGPGTLAAAALLALVLLALSTVRVVVRPAGLTVGLGPWGFPAKRIPCDRILRAGTDVIEPLAYGGWGWRVVPGGTAVVVRGGEALVVELRSGRRFAVTVDGAAEAAALLNAQAQPAAPDAR